MKAALERVSSHGTGGHEGERLSRIVFQLPRFLAHDTREVRAGIFVGVKLNLSKSLFAERDAVEEGRRNNSRTSFRFCLSVASCSCKQALGPSVAHGAGAIE